MTVITAVELREKLGEIVTLVDSGEDVLLRYRNNKTIKLVSTTPKKEKNNNSFHQFLDYLNSPEYDQYLKEVRERNNDDILTLYENDPRAEKLYFRSLRK